MLDLGSLERLTFSWKMKLCEEPGVPQPVRKRKKKKNPQPTSLRIERRRGKKKKLGMLSEVPKKAS